MHERKERTADHLQQFPRFCLFVCYNIRLSLYSTHSVLHTYIISAQHTICYSFVYTIGILKNVNGIFRSGAKVSRVQTNLTKRPFLIIIIIIGLGNVNIFAFFLHNSVSWFPFYRGKTCPIVNKIHSR